MIISQQAVAAFDRPVTVTVAEAGSFACQPGDTILSAALRAGFGLPYECSVGSCSSCKCQVVEGEVQELRPDPPGLRESDRRRGKRLACQSLPLGDCTVSFRADDAYVPMIRPALRPALLVSATPVTQDITAFLFRAQDPAEFLPGQYALLRLPGVELPRPYSMSNIANPDGFFEFMIRRVPNGEATGKLFDGLRPGDEIRIDAPYSIAYLRSPSPRPIACIAGGSGLAPILSILRGAAADPALCGRRIEFFYGARSPADLPAPALFAGLNASFHPVLSMTEPSDNWEGATGFVHEHVGEVLGTTLKDHEFYLAGPPPMVDATRRLLLLDAQVPAEQLHYDRFF